MKTIGSVSVMLLIMHVEHLVLIASQVHVVVEIEFRIQVVDVHVVYGTVSVVHHDSLG